MKIQPCRRSRCQHCDQGVNLLVLDGFGVLRRRHEALCRPPLREAPPPEPTVQEAPQEVVQPESRWSSWALCRRRAKPRPQPTPRRMVVGGGDWVRASRLVERYQGSEEWLLGLTQKAQAARESVRAPQEGEGWSEPCEGESSRWKTQLWYKWSGPTTISTISRVTVRGSLCEVLSLFREADKVANWLPFVTGKECVWSQDVPALLTQIEAKVPIVPRRFGTLIHRAFVDDSSTFAPDEGVYIIEWTPSPSELTAGSYCGMDLPAEDPRASAMSIDLATTYVCPEGPEKCVITTASQNDFGVNKRLIPGMVLRRFLAYNSRVVAQNLSNCLGDLEGFGYQERIEKDAQGFYRAVRSLR